LQKIQCVPWHSVHRRGPRLRRFCRRGKLPPVETSSAQLFGSGSPRVFRSPDPAAPGPHSRCVGRPAFIDSKDRGGGGASTRFHPKRRASIDHRPGPNIARVPLTVPSNTQSHKSPGIVRIFQTSMTATEVPTMGVHRPSIKKIPDPKRIAEVIVMFSGASPHSRKVARTTSMQPMTKRMRSKPMPGQPLANVEYRRRTKYPS